ncbi:hypothetical protein E2C01_005790 [Portunus trituberculatus]|uniref:Uncharacterized protein n=1 Tax=Portunus trituberculatus TaxID=210409 RepID=A0A5B7CVY9_PORTR|nr:hypothetical protein [Portunus trituberculatus]
MPAINNTGPEEVDTDLFFCFFFSLSPLPPLPKPLYPPDEYNLNPALEWDDEFTGIIAAVCGLTFLLLLLPASSGNTADKTVVLGTARQRVTAGAAWHSQTVIEYRL